MNGACRTLYKFLRRTTVPTLQTLYCQLTPTALCSTLLLVAAPPRPDRRRAVLICAILQVKNLKQCERTPAQAQTVSRVGFLPACTGCAQAPMYFRI